MIKEYNDANNTGAGFAGRNGLDNKGSTMDWSHPD